VARGAVPAWLGTAFRQPADWRWWRSVAPGEHRSAQRANLRPRVGPSWLSVAPVQRRHHHAARFRPGAELRNSAYRDASTPRTGTSCPKRETATLCFAINLASSRARNRLTFAKREPASRVWYKSTFSAWSIVQGNSDLERLNSYFFWTSSSCQALHRPADRHTSPVSVARIRGRRGDWNPLDQV
jgi:hypothetical protein